MNEELIKIFAECIEAIEDGRLSVDDCLQQYPQYRAELADALPLALQIQEMPAAHPTPEFRQDARERLLAQLSPRAANGVTSNRHDLGAAAVNGTLASRLKGYWQVLVQRWPLPPRPSLAAGAVLLFVAILFVGLLLRGNGTSDKEMQAGLELPIIETTDPEAEAPAVVDQPDVVEPEEIAAASPEEDPYTSFVPIIAHPLMLNPQTAVLEVLQGVAEVQGADGQWAGVSKVFAATAGQRVRTGALTAATLTFHDGSQATLGPNTEISLDEVDAQRPEDGFRTVVMTQWSGESEHKVDFRGDAGSRYEVLTPNGSGRARGTTFQVVVGPNLVTQYIVTQGRVDVTNINVTVIVIGGQMSVIPPQQPPSQPHFIVTGEGEVTAMGDTWIIGGQPFAVNESTIIIGNPQVGDIVSVSGYLLPDGTLVATFIRLRHQPPVNQFTLTGIVESIGAAEWIISGQAIAINEQTIIDENLVVGDTVRTTGTVQPDGTLLAARIEKIDDGQPFAFVGIVESIGPNLWLISGVPIAIDENTEIDEGIVVGDVVEVEGEILPDGTWLAEEIELEDETGAEFEFTGRVNSIDPWVVAGLPFTTDAFTMIDAGIDVGDLVYVAGQILEDGTWLATEIRLLENEGLNFAFIGVVNSVAPWVIGGISISVDANTFIDDDVTLGSLVEVRGIILVDGTLLATSIIHLEHDDDPIGCFTFTTIVISVSGNQVILEGLPAVTLDDGIEIEGSVVTNTIITISVCYGFDGSITIINIIVIHVPPPPPPPPPPPSNGGDDDDDDDDDD